MLGKMEYTMVNISLMDIYLCSIDSENAYWKKSSLIWIDQCGLWILL